VLTGGSSPLDLWTALLTLNVSKPEIGVNPNTHHPLAMLALNSERHLNHGFITPLV
jgi:hypothetical protein